MRKRLNLLLNVSFLITLSTVGNGQIFLGQGIMSGEISEQTAILQTRLTSSDTLIDGDLPGALDHRHDRGPGHRRSLDLRPQP